VAAHGALLTSPAHGIDDVAVRYRPGKRPTDEPAFALAHQRLGGGVGETHDAVLTKRNDGVDAAVDRGHQAISLLRCGLHPVLEATRHLVEVLESACQFAGVLGRQPRAELALRHLPRGAADYPDGAFDVVRREPEDNATKANDRACSDNGRQ